MALLPDNSHYHSSHPPPITIQQPSSITVDLNYHPCSLLNIHHHPYGLGGFRLTLTYAFSLISRQHYHQPPPASPRHHASYPSTSTISQQPAHNSPLNTYASSTKAIHHHHPSSRAPRAPLSALSVREALEYSDSAETESLKFNCDDNGDLIY